MRKLNRENAIRAIQSVIDEQDNDLLQRIYQDEALGKVLDQADIFKMWHGFLKVEDLPDYVLSGLVDFLRFNDPTLFEYIDYTYLIQEYLETIENEKTQYQTKMRLLRVVKGASAMFGKDLPEISKEEAIDIAEAMMEDTSPATIYRNLLCAKNFCAWCIENQKYPDAQNNFKKLPKISMESWVKRKLVKDDIDLLLKMKAVVPFNEGYAGPVLLALAWLGFSRTEVLQIKNEDVNLLHKTVCGVAISEPLWDIFLQYEGGEHIVTLGQSHVAWKQEDLGYYIKRSVLTPMGKPFDDLALAKATLQVGYTFENIALSKHLYNIYQQEISTGETPSATQLSSELNVSETTVKQSYIEMYRVYKSLFWENA